MNDAQDRHTEHPPGHEDMPDACWHRGCEEPTEVWCFGKRGHGQRYICMRHIGSVEYDDWSSQRVRFVTGGGTLPRLDVPPGEDPRAYMPEVVWDGK